MMLLVTGGSASGKSVYAETQLLQMERGTKLYLATMQCWDEECREKILKHRQQRARKQFITVEQYHDVGSVKTLADGLLLECVSNLAANEYYQLGCDPKSTVTHILEGISGLKKRYRNIVIVTNEIFSDGNQYPAETAGYLMALGCLNQELAKLADRVVEVVFGIPICLK